MERQGRMRSGRAQGRISARWRLGIAGLVAFAGLFLFSFSGLVLSGYRLNQQGAALRLNIQELKTENEQLQKEAAYLESDEGLEKLAREQLGWVKPGEVAVITVPTKREEQPDRSDPAPALQNVPVLQRWWSFFFGR